MTLTAFPMGKTSTEHGLQVKLTPADAADYIKNALAETDCAVILEK